MASTNARREMDLGKQKQRAARALAKEMKVDYKTAVRMLRDNETNGRTDNPK